MHSREFSLSNWPFHSKKAVFPKKQISGFFILVNCGISQESLKSFVVKDVESQYIYMKQPQETLRGSAQLAVISQTNIKKKAQQFQLCQTSTIFFQFPPDCLWTNHCQLALKVKCVDKNLSRVKITENIQIQALKT